MLKCLQNQTDTLLCNCHDADPAFRGLAVGLAVSKVLESASWLLLHTRHEADLDLAQSPRNKICKIRSDARSFAYKNLTRENQNNEKKRFP